MATSHGYGAALLALLEERQIHPACGARNTPDALCQLTQRNQVRTRDAPFPRITSLPRSSRSLSPLGMTPVTNRWCFFFPFFFFLFFLLLSLALSLVLIRAPKL